MFVNGESMGRSNGSKINEYTEL